MSKSKNEAHKAWQRTLICVVCFDNTSVECCHVRFSDAAADKVNPGMGSKFNGEYEWNVLPMCGLHHRMQHKLGREQRFWIMVGIDPIKLAHDLWDVSGDSETAEEIIRSSGGGMEAVIRSGRFRCF